MASPVPRLDRRATPGFSGGLSYDLGGIRLGLLGRIRRTAEFIRIQTVAQPSRVFQIEGYAEPVPLDLHPARYERRYEQEAYALGASAAFAALGGDWALYGLRERTSEDQFVRLLESDPPKDVWDADGWKFGIAGQWMFEGAGAAEWLVTLDGEYRTLKGEAFQESLGGRDLTADETQLDLGLDARAQFGNGWLLGGRAELRRSRRDRRDLFAEAPRTSGGSRRAAPSSWAVCSANGSASPRVCRSRATDLPVRCRVRTVWVPNTGATWGLASRSISIKRSSPGACSRCAGRPGRRPDSGCAAHSVPLVRASLSSPDPDGQPPSLDRDRRSGARRAPAPVTGAPLVLKVDGQPGSF